MSTIQEIAEELVNLSVKEVNELSMILKNDSIEPVRYNMYDVKPQKIMTPKQYGQQRIQRKNRKYA